jgi:hypothetical protein
MQIGNVRPPQAAQARKPVAGAKETPLDDMLLQLHPIAPSSGAVLPEGKLRMEAAWDSTSHNSKLLDRVTETAGHIVLTVVVAVDVVGCEERFIVRKDIRYDTRPLPFVPLLVCASLSADRTW